MIRKLALFIRLPAPLRGFWVRSWLRLHALGTSMRLFGVAKVVDCLERSELQSSAFRISGAQLSRDEVAWCVRSVAANGLIGRNCLREAILEYTLLRRCGYPASVRIGVARQGPGLEAHAWVELPGEIEPFDAGVGPEPAAGAYLPFDRPLLPRTLVR